MTRTGSRKHEARSTLGVGAWNLGPGIWDLSFLICHLSFAILLLWRPLFAGEAFFWGTPLLQFVPWQRMAAAMWRAGHLPLWNPLAGCGAPLAANYQTAAFYPLNVLHLLLPAEVALSWTTALHLALAGWGMYGWSRAIGLDRFPAFIGALALEGSGFLVARAALFPSMAFTFPWLAIWLWRAEVLVQRRRLSDALWLGLALGLGLLAGHAQTAFYGGLLLAAYLVFRTLQVATDRARPPRSASLVIGHWSLIACSFVIGVGLAAVQLLPTAELMRLSQRSAGVNYDFAMTYSLWPWRLVTFAAPDFFGNPGRGDYWGYATYWEDAGYVGVLPLLLAVEAVVGRKRGGRRAGEQEARGAGQVWFWVISATIALILALGKNAPVFLFLFRNVPGFNLFQAPARWLAVTAVALAALAALGAQRWPVGRMGQRRGALGVVLGVALLIGGLAALRLVPGMRSSFGLATARLGGTLAVAGILALLRHDASVRLSLHRAQTSATDCRRLASAEPSRRAHGKAWWRAAVGGFVALDLLLFGWPLVPTVDRSLYHASTEAAASLHDEPGSVRVYWPVDPSHVDREYDAEQRVKFSYLNFADFGPRDVDYWWEMREALLPNAGMLDGVALANNFEPLLVGRYAALLEAAVKAPDLLRVMGTTHVASDRPWPGGEKIASCADAGSDRSDRSRRRGPERPGSGRRLPIATLYRLPDALGRAWVIPAARWVSSDEMLATLADPAFDPTAEVLLEEGEREKGDRESGTRDQGPETRKQEAGGQRQRSASSIQHPASSIQHPVSSIQYPASSIQHQVILQDTPNGITIHTILNTPGYLVLADTWYPGWQAAVDGEPVELLRANYAFRAVALDAGEHTVEMRYRPLSVRLGIAVSLGMLIVVAAVWLVRRHGER